MARRLRGGCCNNDVSGCVGRACQARNIEQVQRTLAAEGCHVWVYESFSLEELIAGELDGRWLLGCRNGACVGALVWLASEKHVVRLLDVQGLLTKELCWRRVAEVAPWFRYSVGAPKGNQARI